MPSPLPWATAEGVPSATSLGSRNRRNDIQGLRAVAVLLVIAVHAGLPIPGGFVGVDVFFVISGFVITAMLHREWLATGRIRFGDFYVRRFNRLTPALALMVTVTVIASTFVLSPLGTQQTTAQTAIGAMMLVANVVIARTTGGYFDAPADTNPLLNTWSLSVEEQFYLVFPFVLALGWYLVRRFAAARFAPLLVVAAVTAVSFALSVASTDGHTFPIPTESVGFYGPLTRAWEFGAGSLLALAATTLPRQSRVLGALLGLSGATMLIAAARWITEATPYPGAAALLPVAGTILLIFAGSASSNPVSRCLGIQPMVAIGNLSYSWYLWHWPVIVFATLLATEPHPVIAAAVSILPAIASYRWLEQPLRNLRLQTAVNVRRLVAFTLTPPLVAAALLWGVATNGFWQQSVKIYQSATGVLHAGATNDCDSAISPDERYDGACVWNADASGSPIYLVGDSNADQFSEAVIGAATHLGRPVTISTANGCPFVDIDFTYTRGSDASNVQCRDYVRGTLTWLEEQPPGLVILASSDDYWNDPAYTAGSSPGTLSADPGSKLAVLEAGLEVTVNAIQSTEHRVLMVQTVPHFLAPFPYEPVSCNLAALISGTCRQDMPLSFTIDKQQGAWEAVDRAAVITRSAALDLREHLCVDGTCSTRTDERITYADFAHISVQESELLAPVFTQAIERAESP